MSAIARNSRPFAGEGVQRGLSGSQRPAPVRPLAALFAAALLAAATQAFAAEPGTSDAAPDPAPAAVEPAAQLPAPGSATPVPEAEPAAASDATEAASESRLAELSARVDRVLAEAADDLDLDLRYQASTTVEPVDEEQLLRASSGGHGIAAQLLPHADRFLLRLCVARPNQATIVVARAEVEPETLEVRTIQLLQLAAFDGAVSKSQEPAKPPTEVEEPARSSGRALLSAHGALVGGYLGFSLDHIAGSGDARLVYPLMTIGAGAGVGASLVIAEEWDVSAPEAWYIWAAGTWSTVSGRLIAASAEGATDSSRYGYSLAGTALGLTLGTVALNTGEVSPGGALLAHSGALFGAHFGGIGQMMIRGSTQVRPTLGIGVGMGAGLLIAGAIAPHAQSLSSSRVLFVDVSAILGGLAGAALASPILVGEELSRNESRIWLGAIALGTLSGAVVGTLLTTGETAPPMFSVTPWVDLLPAAPGHTGSAPVWGLNGTF